MEKLTILAGLPLALLLTACPYTAHIADDTAGGAAGQASETGGTDSTESGGTGGKASGTGGASTVDSGGAGGEVEATGGARADSSGGGGNGHSTGGASGAAGSGEAGARGSEVPALCDGKDRLRFATTNGGGNYSGVPPVAQESGYGFLVIDGHCQYWVMDGWDLEVRSGSLSREQASEFASDLQLGDWEPRTPPGCPDAGTTTLRFGDDTISFSCESEEQVILTNLGSWQRDLYDVGAALTGDVRYNVWAAGTTSGWPQSEYADDVPGWPLDFDPATISADLADASPTHRAKGDEADLLRELRAAYQAAPLSSAYAPWIGIPVVYDGGSEPAYYDVAVRDVLPFEVDGRLAPDELF